MTRWGLCGVMLAACADPPDLPAVPGTSDTVASVETAETVEEAPEDTAPEPVDSDVPLPSFVPYGFYLEVWFGYDPVSDGTKPFTFGTLESHTWYRLFIFAEDWDGLPESREAFCEVSFVSQVDQPRANWLAPFTGYSFGFSRAQVDVSGDCDGRLGRSRPVDVQASVAQLRWGFAVSPTMDPAVVTALTDAGLSEADLVQFIGGGLLGDVVDMIQPNALLANGWVQGFSTDDQLVVELNLAGEGRPLDAAQMVVDGQLQRGVFVLGTLGMPWELLSAATGLPASP